MMRYNFTFICRDSKADRNGKAPIEMTIGIGGKYNKNGNKDQNKKGYSSRTAFFSFKQSIYKIRINDNLANIIRQSYL